MPLDPYFGEGSVIGKVFVEVLLEWDREFLSTDKVLRKSPYKGSRILGYL